MKKRKWGKKKILKIFLAIILVVAIGIGGYAIYGSYKLNQLSTMTFDEMMDYTTKDNKDAVITVGIIQNGKITYDVYGKDGMKLAPVEHIYEIGSITKTFTTSLLSKAISEDKISLDSSIDEYLNLPSKGYYPTIRRLVTHMSGYKPYYFEKPMISNFFSGVNDFNGISEEMLIERLGKINLKDSDYSFEYSNFGMSVIGVVLEQIYNEDFTTLMNKYVSGDLGLLNTRISDGSGDLSNYWTWSKSDAYMPAGALLSNITDMMGYVEMQMNENPDYLDMAHDSLAIVNGSNASYEKMGIRIDDFGIGWMIDKEKKIVWHNGGTDHYNSYIGFDKEKQVGV
ncbi:MAG: serine hydrolase domain-containing protein, partial [Clostridiaceae bacterium]